MNRKVKKKMEQKHFFFASLITQHYYSLFFMKKNYSQAYLQLAPAFYQCLYSPKQWMNYVTNLTLHKQFIHYPLRALVLFTEKRRKKYPITHKCKRLNFYIIIYNLKCLPCVCCCPELSVFCILTGVAQVGSSQRQFLLPHTSFW